jgi:hypothetical protein
MTFNYFKNGIAITKAQFESVVPANWQENLNEYGEYSWGYFKAILRD